VFSQIIAADDFLTFKRMMHARSASLDFQAHLEYEKIRKSGMPGAAAAAVENCGQQVVSRNHQQHEHMILNHQLQQSGDLVAPSTHESHPRSLNPAHSDSSHELQDEDERSLQQAIGKPSFVFWGSPFKLFSIHCMPAELSRLAFEEMRSQVQQEDDDIETAIRLSILEAEENSRRHHKEHQDAFSSAASTAVLHSDVSAPHSDSWEKELEASRQREQQVRFS